MNQRLTKSAALLLAMMMLFGFSACGGKPASEDAEPAGNGEELVLGFGLEEDFEIVEEPDEGLDRGIPHAGEPIRQNVLTKLDGTAIRSDAYLYRELLTDTQKQAYDLIRDGIAEGDEEIQMNVPITKDELKTIVRSVFYDSPDLFWMDGGYAFGCNNYGNVTKVRPKYNGLAQDLAGNRAKFENAVSEALADMWSLGDSAAQVKYAHDYLTHTVDYDLNAEYSQTAFGAIVNRKCVCAGYSRAFQYMMQKMDIRCGYISGFASTAQGSGAHAWNVVELNGEFYAMDVTWDDPVGAKADKYFYTYFNQTDEVLGADHSRSELSAALPVAVGTAKSFSAAFGGNQYGTDFSGIQGALPEGYGGASTLLIGYEPAISPPDVGASEPAENDTSGLTLIGD